MERNEIQMAANPLETLRNQTGQFKVVAPNGYVFQVTCRKGRNIRIREVGALEQYVVPEASAWQIERIA